MRAEGRTSQGGSSWLGRVIRRSVADLVSNASGLTLIIAAVVVFAAAAVGGLSMVGTLGTFGWIAYAAVLGVLALALGPVFVVGVKVRLHGSARHRADTEARVQAQRVKFGLVSSQRPPGSDADDRQSSQRRES